MRPHQVPNPAVSTIMIPAAIAVIQHPPVHEKAAVEACKKGDTKMPNRRASREKGDGGSFLPVVPGCKDPGNQLLPQDNTTRRRFHATFSSYQASNKPQETVNKTLPAIIYHKNTYNRCQWENYRTGSAFRRGLPLVNSPVIAPALFPFPEWERLN